VIKTLTAHTIEVDDSSLAIAELKAQIGTESDLMKNTVGIVACHYEFVLSGVFKEICDAFPFDIAGTISSSQSVPVKTDTLILTLMVLTSDDVSFDTFITPSLLGEPSKTIAKTYKSNARSEKPALIFVFAPFMPQNSGDEYVDIISEVSGGAPCFGTLAIDDTDDLTNCFMLYNGRHYREQMAVITVYGDIHPKFFIANISEDKIVEKRGAVVTKSVGPVVMELNGRPVIEYFEELGITKASETLYAMTSLPFLIDFNDGSPKVSKIFIMLTPEKHAICGGSVPQGSTLYIASSKKDDVMCTTGSAVCEILKEVENYNGLLIYTCISRAMTLGSEQFKEMQLVNEKIGDRLPYMMVCSGGEICPTEVLSDSAVDRFHNNVFAACLF
jgi:hypothetical protein